MRGLVIILVLLAIVVFVILKRRNATTPGKPEGLPYVPGEGLFSPAERSFLGVLDQTVDGHFRVFAKVRVADVLNIAKGTPKSLRQKAFNSCPYTQLISHYKHSAYAPCLRRSHAIAACQARAS